MILEAKVLFVSRQERRRRKKERERGKRNDFLQTWFAGLRNLCYPGCIYKNNVHALTNSVGFAPKLRSREELHNLAGGAWRGIGGVQAFLGNIFGSPSFKESQSQTLVSCALAGLCRCTTPGFSRMDWGGPVERKRKFYHRNCLVSLYCQCLIRLRGESTRE